LTPTASHDLEEEHCGKAAPVDLVGQVALVFFDENESDPSVKHVVV
jgi:hypothetical protein